MKPTSNVIAALVILLLSFPASSLGAQNSKDEKASPGSLPPLIDRELIFGNPEISGAQLSPDGRYLAFQKPWKDTLNIFVKGSDESFSAARLLTTETKRPIAGYFWSRDGKYILYTKDNDGDENYNVYAVDPGAKPATGADAPQSRDLTGLKGVRVQIIELPKKDPDTIYIGLNDRDKAWHDLYRLKLSNGEKTLVRQNTERITGWEFDLQGNLRLATRSAENGDAEILRIDSDKFTKIYSCNVLESCNTIRFQKDGKRAYIETNKGVDLNLRALVLFDPETGKTEMVESDPLNKVDFGGAFFSETTDELASTWYQDDHPRLYFRDHSLETDFNWLRAQFPGKEVRWPSSTLDEQVWLVTASADTEPGETYLFDRKIHKLTLQYKLQEKLPRDALAEMKPIHYESSDGLEIPAYLTLPKGVPNRKLPTIIFPHGGPGARDVWGYNAYAQFFANRGYAVLSMNFRGSTGYGKKFLDAGNMEWGRKMQDDVTWGVKYLVDEGISDPKRVGIFGASYGGYITLVGVTSTPDLYAAAVDLFGPSNLIMPGGAPYWEARRQTAYQRMGNPMTPEGRALLVERSPLASADKIRTPLMIVQGSNDPRVNLAQSDQIVIALRDRGFPLEYLLIPDEGHGFARPVNHLASVMATEKFFAKYLGGLYQVEGTPEVTARLKEITVDPKAVKDMNAQLALGVFYQQLNRMPEAEQQFKSAIDVDPKNPAARAALVRLYMVEGKKTEAEAFLKHAQNDLSGNPDGYRMLGDFYFANGDLDKATAEYSSLYSNHPKDIQVKKNYVQLVILKNRLDEATKLNNEVLKSNPNDVDALVYRGQIQLRQNDTAGAVDSLQQALKNDSNNAVAHYHLGRAFDMQHNEAQAELELREAVRLRPDLTDAQRSLAELELRRGAPQAAQGSVSQDQDRPPAGQEQTPPQPEAPGRVRVSQGVSQGLLVRKVNPTYPPLARQARISGTVVLRAVISKDGAIENLTLVSGHPMLVPAAIDAVKQWKYKPYLLNGQPVELDTEVLVNFALSAGLAVQAEPVAQLKAKDYVNDFAHVLDQNMIAQMDEICRQIDEKAHAQIAVVTAIYGYDIESYAVHIFHQLGVGFKETNRGVLILYGIDDHRARIKVGYALKPILTDGKVGEFQLEAIPLMRAGSYDKALLLLTSRVAAVIAQDAGVQLTTPQLSPVPDDVATKQDAASQDFLKEGAVFEQITTRVVFQPDGTYTYDQHTRVRVQSDAGVRQYGILRFPYQASVGGVDVQDVRVTKPNGSVVSTPLDSIQDMTSEVSREAPMYSDLREKHVPVKGLEPGDTLECSVRWRLEKPLATGQFWIGYQFLKNTIVLDEQLEISVPREREVKLKSQTIQPTTREENGRRIYTWKTSNLESVSVEEQKKVQNYDAMRGLLPPSDVLISSFRTWEEVGQWYGRLQQEKIQPSPEVKEKAEELTKGLSDDDAKLLAIYNYVSLRYRYVAISFGIGRYQPHAAAEILGNQYGDCKDKHTLLAALLSAVGIRAYPALINSRMAVDADVPSPGQFDHVISVVAKGNTLSWMDTTPEVTAIGYLVYPLRGKPALVIMPDKVAFQTTPTNSPFANKLASTVTAKLGSDGTLQAHVDTMFSGDDGIYFRYTFRRVPQSQWKDLIHQMFYGGRLGGTIGDVGASPIERTEEPFNVAYDYALKDFAGGDKHRFTVPLAPLSIPEVKDEDLNRKIPLWLGYVGEYQYESRIELPKGWSATTPVPIDFKESFAEFQGSSEVHEGMLITKRRLLLKASEVTPDQLKSYKTFQKAISDDHNTYIFLRAPADVASIVPAGTPAQGPDRLAQLIRDVATLPGSSNTHALQAEQDARKSMQTKDYTSAITALKYAVSIDATFSRAWIELGLAYAYSKDKSSTLDALQKAVEADPKQVLPYKLLAFNYMLLGNRDNAIATWQKLQGIAPGDSDLAFYLGALYLEQKRYPEATSLLESAAKSNPSDAYAQVMLGTVRLRSHNTDQGLDALHKALEIDSGPLILNNVAYELAEAGTNLPEALGYSQRSVKEVEEQSQKVDLENIQKADLQLSSTIGAYWDTLGWIYFKMGDLARAESYLNSAWQLRQDGLVGDHLGQVYEKEQKLPTALHMYNLALEANPRLEETQSRMRNLAHVHLPKNRMSAAEELTLMRTIKLPSITKDTVSADFDVLIVPGGTIDKANFSRGSELLRHAGESLEKTPVEEPFPPNSTARLLRRGTLSCSGSRCSFVFYRPSVGAGAN